MTAKGRKGMWVYRETEIGPRLYTVGFYSPDGRWHPDSDHAKQELAAERCHYLNGGNDSKHTLWESGKGDDYD
jgi:hypothetical protein